MDFNNDFDKQWENSGTEPPQSIFTSGFLARLKPPAQYFNWFWSKAIAAITELQTKLSEVDTRKSEATNIVNGSQTGSTRTTGSTAEGVNYSMGTNAHAEGRGTQSSGAHAHAEGNLAKASGIASHAEGSNTQANGDYSHAEGRETTATGNNSHTEGYATTATGNNSHAEGRQTVSEGSNSHAEGLAAEAMGDNSHAEGYATTATGNNSHAEGNNTQTNVENQHVQGKFNIIDDESVYAHIVGNGTSNENKSNAHTLDWNGNAWFAGDVSGRANGMTINLSDMVQLITITGTMVTGDNKSITSPLGTFNADEYTALRIKDGNTAGVITVTATTTGTFSYLSSATGTTVNIKEDGTINLIKNSGTSPATLNVQFLFFRVPSYSISSN